MPDRGTANPSGARTLAGIVIVVIEDEDDSRELIGELLVETGAIVYLAHDAEQGLQHVIRHRPNIIVSDIGMPDRDGCSLISRVRGLEGYGAEVPAVAYTGYTSPANVRTAIEAGFTAHLAKPAAPAALLELIEQLVCRR